MQQESSSEHGRHGRLMLWCALAGAGSGLLSLLFGEVGAPIRGGLVGLCLASGLAALNMASRHRLDSGQPPGTIAVIVAGAGSGLVAGAALACFTWWATGRIAPPRGLPVLDTPGRAESLALGLCYGLALHTAYGCRRHFNRFRTAKILSLLAIAGLFVGTVRGALAPTPGFAGVWPVGAFTGLPFAVLWAWAVICVDPAWTTERWQQGKKKGRVEQSPAVALGGSF